MEIKIFSRGERADYSAFLEGNNADLDIYYSLSFLEVESNQQDVGFEIFTATERGDLFVYPYFKLQISKPHEGWYDIGSPFGYAGPWCNSPEFFAKAEKQLVDYLSERCVSEFVRYHFLYNQTEDQRFALNCQNHFNRDIVVTNLTEGTPYDPAQHMSSRNLKYYRSLMAGGFSFRFYSIPDYYELFTGMYHDTMRQAGAAADKFFPGSYFLALYDALGDKCRVAGVEKDGIIYSMVFFFDSGGILQYYLSGRDLRFTKVPSSVVMFVELARWAAANSRKLINFGGGKTTGPDDPIFLFKKSISDTTRPYYIGKRIHNQKVYDNLTEAYIEKHGQEKYMQIKHMIHFYREI